MFDRVHRIYISRFLQGLVFWYGIEKLFLQDIGVSPQVIGLLVALYMGVMLLLEVPAGILADKWSRKRQLAAAMFILGAGSFIMGISDNAWMYGLGYIFYAIYAVGVTGTEQALLYDILHEEGRSKIYAKIAGRSYALMLIGAGVANIASGFIADWLSLPSAFLLSVIPSILSGMVILSIAEPTFHKKSQQKQFLRQVAGTLRNIWGFALLRTLTVIWCGLHVGEVFKEEFSQLYVLEFTNSAILLGLFWAGYAFTWALGSALAHRYRQRMLPVVLTAIALFVIFGLVGNEWALIAFMAQSVVVAVALMLIETEVQEVTPSAVRASVLSAFSMLGSMARIPAALGLGWITSQYSIFTATQVLAAGGVLLIIYAVIMRKRLSMRVHVGDQMTPVDLAPKI